jgi:centromeric protein E
VDLAGSERAKGLGKEGRNRFTEGCYINKSLLTLGMCIRKLSKPAKLAGTSNKDNKDNHVPFRDSKLTRLLQPALGGNARAAVVCCMTPAAGFIEHSLATLKFAQRCSRVTNYAASA